MVFEHFSRPPSPRQLGTALMKTAWALLRWFRGKKTRRPTLGLVLSAGRPSSALEFFRLLRPSRVHGVYRTNEPGLELILVDVARLPKGPGTSFLRLLDHRRPVTSRRCVTCRTTPPSAH